MMFTKEQRHQVIQVIYDCIKYEPEETKETTVLSTIRIDDILDGVSDLFNEKGSDFNYEKEVKDFTPDE